MARSIVPLLSSSQPPLAPDHCHAYRLFISAVCACARQGILLKGGLNLDALASCTLLPYDKTGTLTTGQLTFLGIESPTARSAPESSTL